MSGKTNSINASKSGTCAASGTEATGLETTGLIFDIKRYAIHDGPGIRTTVFFKGCPLQCKWCHNPESWRFAPELALRLTRCLRCGQCVSVCVQNAVSFTEDFPLTKPDKCTCCGQCVELCQGGAREIIGRQITVAEVMEEVEKDIIFYDESGGGVTFSGGEPLLQPEFLLAGLNQCRKRQIHTAVDTSCHAQPDVLEKIGPKADLFLCDLKHMNNDMHLRYTGVENTLILENIRYLSQAGKQIIIRIPIVPGFNDDPDNVEACGQFAASLPGVTRIDILPYNCGGNEKAARLATGINLMEAEMPDDEHMASIADRFNNYGLEIKTGG